MNAAADATTTGAGGAPSPWAPLRTPIYRAFWIASCVSFIGTWMQEVAAAWLMTTLTSSPILIGMVQTAAALPIVLLALPAGALADILDRRRLLIATLAWMLAASGLLGILALAGSVGATGLLALLFAVGIGTALVSPAWQAIMPDLVDRRDLAGALALNGIAINSARAVGPAVGGLVVAALGPGPAFLLNAVSFIGVIVVLSRWRNPQPRSLLPAEHLLGAMAAGLRYARHAPGLQAVLWRSGLFILSGSAVWALLPVLVRFELGGDATAYGLAVGCLGAGAVAGALALPRLRRSFDMGLMVAVATLLYAGATLGLALGRWPAAVALCLGATGFAWLVILTSLHTAAQSALAPWVRGRGLAVYFLVFFAGMAGGSLFWGAVARATAGPRPALVLSATGLIVALAATARLRLPGRIPEPGPARHPIAPSPLEPDDAGRGPVLVTVEYRIAAADAEPFARAMQEVRRFRLRDGAFRWHLLTDPETPERFVESFLVESWVEHLRQHERITAADRETEAAARRFHRGSGPPRITHFIARDLRS
jgi:MFS family permease